MSEISRPVLIPMDHAYLVSDWRELYETAESAKRVAPMEWVRMYTKHDSRGYKRVLRLKNGEKVYLGFLSIVQVAAKMPCRGLLAADGGPLEPQDLEDKTGISAKTFAAAFEALVSEKIGWLERVPWDNSLKFDANLAKLKLRKSGQARGSTEQHAPARDGTEQHAPAAPPVQENATSTEGGPARGSTPPAHAGTSRHVAARDGTAQHTAARNGTEEKTGEEIKEIKEIPPTVPQGGPAVVDSDASIEAEELKQLLLGAFNREEHQWSSELDKCLDAIAPIPRDLWPLIHEWFSLPVEHPLWQVTKRLQRLSKLIASKDVFWDEVDKMRRHAPLFMGSAGRGEKEPELWREVLFWVRGEQIRLPDTFAQLDRDFRQEYRANLDAYKAQLVKK